MGRSVWAVYGAGRSVIFNHAIKDAETNSVVPSSGKFVMHSKSLTPKEFHNKAQGQRRSRATLGKDVNHDPKPQWGFTETSFLCATPLGLRKVLWWLLTQGGAATPLTLGYDV